MLIWLCSNDAQHRKGNTTMTNNKLNKWVNLYFQVNRLIAIAIIINALILVLGAK